MKKLSIFICLFFSFNLFLDAACDYKTKKELNTLASYVDYSYDYDAASNSFDVTVYNLSDNLTISSSALITRKENEIVIKDLQEGSTIKLNIIATNNDCEGNQIRILTINIPYLNPYYDTSECLMHQSLNVCSSRFLDYKLSEEAFNTLINRDNSKKENEGIDDEAQVEASETFFDRLYSVLSKLYIPVLLVIASSVVTYMVFKPLYRKIKHGL